MTLDRGSNPLNSTTTKKLYLEFGKEEIIETKRVTKYYNLVVTREFEKAKTFRNMNNFEIFIDDEKEKFYVSASLLMSYLENDLSIVDFVRKQSKLIDYPQVIKKTILTDSETLILGIIMENSPIDRDIIMEKLLVIIENDDLHITGRNIFAKCQVIFWLTKNYGKQKKHDKVIQLCNKGIMLNKDNYTYYLLEYFYYYKALSCLRTNLFIEFEDNLYNALMVLELMDFRKRDRFYKIILKDTKIDPFEFIIDRYNKRING